MFRTKTLIFYGIALMLCWLFVELMAGAAILRHYRAKGQMPQLNGLSHLASAMVVQKVLQVVGVTPRLTIMQTCRPEPCFVQDDAHGFLHAVGRHEYTFSRPAYDLSAKPQLFRYVATVLPDHSRYVGEADTTTHGRVLVFGDSFVHGDGVNDEHTFTALLQQRFRTLKFELHAAGGHSLTNAYIRFKTLGGSLTARDVVVLGYADYYKIRHVAAPSRLKEWIPGLPYLPKSLRHTRAQLDEHGGLVLDTVPLSCVEAPDYCAQPDPSPDHMDRVTAKLINEIAAGSPARVILLHFEGAKSDPVLRMLSSKVEVVSTLDEDFDHVIRDDIMGFDGHPGPFWHYQMYRRLVPAFEGSRAPASGDQNRK